MPRLDSTGNVRTGEVDQSIIIVQLYTFYSLDNNEIILEYTDKK